MTFDPLEPCIGLTFQSLPEATLDLLQAYLNKECSVDQFIKALSCCAVTNSDSEQGPKVLGFVSGLDVAHEASKAISRYKKLVGRSFYFTVMPSDGDLVLGLRWSRSFTGDSWGLVVTDKIKVDMVCQFCIGIPWLESMVQLAVAPLKPLVRSLTVATGDRAVGVDDEIHKRASVFNAASNAYYFQNVKLFLMWEIARSWLAWEKSAVPFHTRVAEVAQVWSPELALVDFNKLAPEQFLKSVIRRPKRRRDGPYCPATRRAILSQSMDSAKPFSRGGDWADFLYRDNATVYQTMPEKGDLKNPAEIERSLWWWRSIPEWEAFMQDEFRDNWSRSAFMYELRARLLPTRTWDIFNSPWFHLDVSQKGVLYYIWPPGHPRGKFWRQGRIYGDNQEEHAFANVPVRNHAAMRKEERVMWEEQFNVWKHDLLGQPSERKQRSVPKRGPDWDLLEALDRIYYLPNDFVLTTPQIKRRKTAKKLHAEACKEAGLPEDRPCYTRS